jgi:hypothetical protein
MPARFVDVEKLPFEQSYASKNGNIINMRELLDGLRAPINILGTTGNIGQVDSLGFAMAEPMCYTCYDLDKYWDDYMQYVWFVGGWGPDRNMFIANAVRKMRPMLREQTDTLTMRHDKHAHSFMNPVDQVDADARFPWGDFPWGGAVSLFMGGMFFEAAVSCFDDDVDDDIVATLAVGVIAKNIIRGDGLLPLDD